MWWIDGCNILCLLIWQRLFFFHWKQQLGAANASPRMGPEGWVLESQVTLGPWPSWLQERSGGALWRCKNKAAFTPALCIALCSHAAWSWKTFSESGCRTPFAQRELWLLGNPHFQIYLTEPCPICLGCPQSVGPYGPHAQWPPHFTELIYGKGWLGSRAPPENRSRAGPLLWNIRGKQASSSLSANWLASMRVTWETCKTTGAQAAGIQVPVCVGWGVVPKPHPIPCPHPTGIYPTYLLQDKVIQKQSSRG